MIQYLGLWLLAAVALNMWAWLSVLQSGSRVPSVLFWTALLLCLPGIGYLIWFLLGPRAARGQ